MTKQFRHIDAPKAIALLIGKRIPQSKLSTEDLLLRAEIRVLQAAKQAKTLQIQREDDQRY